MPNTARLGLPLLAAAQAQKHVTHNDALLGLDGLAQIGVLDKDVNAPPATPNEGDMLLVGSAPMGGFAGQAGMLALYVSGGWRFYAPKAGWIAFVATSQRLFVFDGAKWRGVDELARSFGNLAGLGVGTAPDATNLLALKANAALVTAKYAGEGGSGDFRLTLNKEKPGATVSQLYQSNWSGRAETGLSGDDKWHLKLSPDGASWREALLADPVSGAVRIDTLLSGRAAPGFAARCEIEFAGPTLAGLALNDTGAGSNPAISFRKAGAVVGSITASATGIALNTTSDYRLKTTPEPIKDALGRIERLKPWRFAFKAEPERQVTGFLAHELSEIVPEAVQGARDGVDAAGEPIYQTVDLTRLVPLLVGAVQTLSARLIALETRGAP
jgi:hypothetical protein